MIAHAYNPNTWEAEAGGSRVQGQPQQCNKFEASLMYRTPCLKKEMNQTTKSSAPTSIECLLYTDNGDSVAEGMDS